MLGWLAWDNPPPKYQSSVTQPPKKPPTSKNSNPPSTAWVLSLLLDEDNKRILDGGQWLNNKHMYAAQKLLKAQFPDISGLQSMVLAKGHQRDVSYLKENRSYTS